MKQTALAAILWLSLLISTGLGQGIAITNGTARVSWPLTGYHYLLQSTTNLADPSAWSNVASASPVTAAFAGNNVPVITNFSGSNLFLIQPAANTAQFFQLISPATIPVFCFAIFYNQPLEFSDSATLAFNGLIHANGPVYTGPATAASQTFNGTVTTTGNITSPDRAGVSTWSTQIYFNANPPFVTNAPAFIPPVTTNNLHYMIDIPPPPIVELAFSALGRSRLYNQAGIILVVTNSPLGGSPRIWLTLQTSYNGNLPGIDPSKIVYDLTNATELFLKTNATIPLPFLSLTNTLVDQRQGPNAQFVTQIDVNKLNSWMTTNLVVLGKFAGVPGPTILYVADRRNLNTTTQAVVRLVNGAKLPYNNSLGFTVATQNPLYVKGNYNTTVDSNTYALTLRSTTNGATVPAALIADAITLLSPSWQDAASASSYTSRNASSMTVNAALLCGNVPSTGLSASTFSGGVQNLPRFLEDWTGDTLVLNTSLVCLFASQTATNQFKLPTDSAAYYATPTRLWGFDATFLNPSKLPPGTPVYSLP